jgi:hypothetical protein
LVSHPSLPFHPFHPYLRPPRHCIAPHLSARVRVAVLFFSWWACVGVRPLGCVGAPRDVCGSPGWVGDLFVFSFRRRTPMWGHVPSGVQAQGVARFFFGKNYSLLCSWSWLGMGLSRLAARRVGGWVDRSRDASASTFARTAANSCPPASLHFTVYQYQYQCPSLLPSPCLPFSELERVPGVRRWDGCPFFFGGRVGASLRACVAEAGRVWVDGASKGRARSAVRRCGRTSARRDASVTLPLVFPKKFRPRPVPFHPYFYILFIRHYTLLGLLDPSLFFSFSF